MRQSFVSLLLLTCISSFSGASPTENVIRSRQETAPKGSKHLRPVLEKRQEFDQGQPIDGKGKGAPILGWLNPWRIYLYVFKAHLFAQVERTNR